MTLLVAGLVLFIGIHLVPAVPPVRSALVGGLGEGPYKLAFTVVALLGIAAIVFGYRDASAAPWFAPVDAAVRAAPLAVTVALVLFAAANLRSHIRRVVRHPMLIGLGIWALVHLLANGEARATVLFASLLGFAVVDLASAIQRGAVKQFEPSIVHDVVAVVAGVVAAFVFAYLHPALFGAVAIR